MKQDRSNLLKEIKGMKFPDLYVTKFFFKENLNESTGNVIELGCGNGNNLWLFYSYGYNVCGIDINNEAIENAKFNFENLFFHNGSEYLFIKEDILNLGSIKKTILNRKKFDILLMPNVINYIRKKDFINLLQELTELLNKKGKLFIRFRSPRDTRIGMGKRIGNNEYLLCYDEITGEKDAILSVYEESEMIYILRLFLKLKDYKIFHLYEENYHTDRKVLNADIVIWGNYEL